MHELPCMGELNPPLSQDTESQNMFPVAGPTNLDNFDFSFLDELPSFESKELFDNIEMEGHQISFEGAPVSDDCDINYIPVNLTLSCEENVPLSLNFQQVLQSDIFLNTLPIQDFSLEKPEFVEQTSSSDISKVPELTDMALLSNTAIESDISLDEMTDYKQPCVAEKKYLHMRKKNNIASQRSRKLRKQKNQEMFDKLKILEDENSKLVIQVEELEKQRDALQSQLLSILSKK